MHNNLGFCKRTKYNLSEYIWKYTICKVVFEILRFGMGLS